jgi:hypothetical protein
MAGEFDGFALVDQVQSACLLNIGLAEHSVLVAVARPSERHRSHRDKPSAP